MNITALVPAPARREAFRRNRERFIPDKPGCYALTNFSKEVMYVGLAKNLAP
jgi:excinuclease UvrABC nuclease subunit